MRQHRAARRLRRFHRRCDRLQIPADVRARLLKISDRAPDWYAGRKELSRLGNHQEGV